MSDNNDRALGRVEGKIDLMIENNNRIIDNQNKADASRKQLREAIEALRGEITDYRRRLEDLEKRMDAVEQPVAELKVWRERSIGVIVTLSGLAALIGGTFAYSWQKIMDIFR